MGFMDKAKEAAMQAKLQAQQLAQQGQTKVQTMQAGRNEAQLQQALGEAYYNQVRRGGDPSAVDSALAALDQHYAAAQASAQMPPPSDNGTVGDGSTGAPMSSPVADPMPGDPAPGMVNPTVTPPSAPPTAGNFTLDDL